MLHGMNTTHHRPSPCSAFTNAFTEVLGEIDGLAGEDQLVAENSSDRLMELCNRLASHYNPVCACGLAQQIGRSAFTHLLRENNGLTGLTGQSFRLMPGRLRLMRGFNQLETLIEDVFEIPVAVIDAADAIQLKTSDESARHDLIPYLEAGFIQEFVQWVSGGKFHQVMVNGGPPGWSVVVGKQPLDS